MPPHTPTDGATVAATPSLDGTAYRLQELAGLLQEGWPDPNLIGRLAHALAPTGLATVAEVGVRLATWAGRAEDDYRDAVALFGALSVKVRESSTAYAGTVAAARDQIDRFLIDPDRA
jgi:hypothetical protein